MLVHRRRNAQEKSKRRFWVHPINQRRQEQGECHHLCSELWSHEDRFFVYFWVVPAEFDFLVSKITPFVQTRGSNYRSSIAVQEKLAVCLRYVNLFDWNFNIRIVTFSQEAKQGTAVAYTMKFIYTHTASPSEENWDILEANKKLCISWYASWVVTSMQTSFHTLHRYVLHHELHICVVVNIASESKQSHNWNSCTGHLNVFLGVLSRLSELWRPCHNQVLNIGTLLCSYVHPGVPVVHTWMQMFSYSQIHCRWTVWLCV